MIRGQTAAPSRAASRAAHGGYTRGPGFARVTASLIFLAFAEPVRAEPAGAPGAVTPVERQLGPSGSLVLVESNRNVPLVEIAVAVRSGSAWDPHKKDGLAHLFGQTARRGAAGRGRIEIDSRLDALGATLEVAVDPDSMRFEGHVLPRNLDAYLAVIGDILLRPDFGAAEIARSRRDILAKLDEARNDDRELCQRFFVRNLYGDHPYGHAPEGDRASLERIRREDLLAFQRKHVVGGNLIFAATGDISASDFAASVARWFGTLPPAASPGPNPLSMREPQPPHGWRIQVVDKPDRLQVQLQFGQLGVRAADPDYLPLLVAINSFGGPAMKATLMDELRTKRGLAYGAYMTISQRLARGSLTGWVLSSTERAIPTLKLVLKLFLDFMNRGIDERHVAFSKTFLAGTRAVELDEPGRRLDARVTAEVAGLPTDFVDGVAARIGSVTASDVNAAIARHIRARDLAITAVATGPLLRQLLVDAKIDPGAIDLVPFDKY